MIIFNLFTIIYWLSAHYICDFIFQNKHDAENKSSSIETLLDHTSIYAISMGVLYYFIGGVQIDEIICFISIMFASHTLIDFISSRVESYLYSKNKIRGFFNVLGLDQLLHYAVLFLTLKYL